MMDHVIRKIGNAAIVKVDGQKINDLKMIIHYRNNERNKIRRFYIYIYIYSAFVTQKKKKKKEFAYEFFYDGRCIWSDTYIKEE